MAAFPERASDTELIEAIRRVAAGGVAGRRA
jgi:hypothetical protein